MDKASEWAIYWGSVGDACVLLPALAVLAIFSVR